MNMYSQDCYLFETDCNIAIFTQNHCNSYLLRTNHVLGLPNHEYLYPVAVPRGMSGDLNFLPQQEIASKAAS